VTLAAGFYRANTRFAPTTASRIRPWGVQRGEAPLRLFSSPESKLRLRRTKGGSRGIGSGEEVGVGTTRTAGLHGHGGAWPSDAQWGVQRGAAPLRFLLVPLSQRGIEGDSPKG